jgi:hypothetical protein
VKIYILSAAILFFLFLTFFCRQFPKYNRWFAAYLIFTVALQVLFAAGVAGGFMARIPMNPLDVVGLLLIGVAAITAARAQDAVNGIIQDGLVAILVLNLISIAAIWWHGSPELRTMLINFSCCAPTGYMLVRFTFAMSDGLPLWVQTILNSKINIQEAAGMAARAILG